MKSRVIIAKNKSLTKVGFNLNSSILKVYGKDGKNILNKKFNPKYFKFVSKDLVYVQDKKYLKTFLAHIQNLTLGAKQGWFYELDLIGLGFRMFYYKNKHTLGLDLGFSHITLVTIPFGIQVQCTGTKILVYGINKEQVSLWVSKIYNLKKPDPYKGKGFRYKGQKVRLKKDK